MDFSPMSDFGPKLAQGVIDAVAKLVQMRRRDVPEGHEVYVELITTSGAQLPVDALEAIDGFHIRAYVHFMGDEDADLVLHHSAAQFIIWASAPDPDEPRQPFGFGPHAAGGEAGE